MVTIAGYNESTKIAPLLQAFETINLDVTLPGLKTDLLSSAALTGETPRNFYRPRLMARLVLPTTGHDNNIARVSVALMNPFTAGLAITGVRSNVSTHGIPLGTIRTSTNFASVGRSTTNSPDLDLNMNMDPTALFTVTYLCAVAAGLSTEQLDGIMAIGGYKYLHTTGGDNSGTSPKNLKRVNIYTYVMLTLLPTVILTMIHVVALISRTSSIRRLNSYAQTSNSKPMYRLVSVFYPVRTFDGRNPESMAVGDYKTTLRYTQPTVPIKTDDTLNLLLPVLAKPVVQKIVSGSALR